MDNCIGAAGAVNNNAQTGSVVIANGENVTCIITNDDQAASLTIVKRIVNDNGGTKVVGDFGITTSAGGLTFGTGAADGANTLKYTATTLTGLTAGSKTLHENTVTGYTEGAPLLVVPEDRARTLVTPSSWQAPQWPISLPCGHGSSPPGTAVRDREPAGACPHRVVR